MQGKLVENKSESLMYEYRNAHNQILLTGSNHVSINFSSTSVQCKMRGVVAIALKCSKNRCVDVKSNKTMTKDLADKMIMLIGKRSRHGKANTVPLQVDKWKILG